MSRQRRVILKSNLVIIPLWAMRLPLATSDVLATLPVLARQCRSQSQWLAPTVRHVVLQGARVSS
eukprot:2999502-Pyramimonas_sp.AAC.1